MKMWIKTYVGDKITHDIIITSDKPLTPRSFYDAVSEAAHAFDLSTPIILNQHFLHYRDYNSVKLLPRDFIEEVDFDKFIIENAQDN